MRSSLLSFALIFFGALGLGWTLRHFRAWASTLMTWTILLVEAWIFLYSYWVLDLSRLKALVWLPLASAFLVIGLLWLSPRWARPLGLTPAGEGSFVLASAFSNIGGTGGAFLCYACFGVPGLSLAYLFLLPYPFLIFTAGFSTARRYASPGRLTWKDYLDQVLKSPISLVSLLAMGLGAGLNLGGWVPAAGWARAIDILIRLDVGLMCLAIGMTLDRGSWFSPWRPVAAVAVIKYLLTPLAGALLAWVCYGSFAPLPAKVLLLESMMPPAMYSVVTSHLFNLDRRLANSLWLTNSLLLLPVLLVAWWFAK